MRIRTTILAAAIAVLPALAMAQSATPDAGNPPAAQSTPNQAMQNQDTNPQAGTPHRHRHAEMRQMRAERHAKYEQLSAIDKAKYDEIGKQIRQLNRERLDLLGLKKS